MAHLDLLAVALNKEPNSRAYLVAYSHSSVAPGDFLMRIYGYQDYLVNMRGIEPGRVEIVLGGMKDKLYTELWLVPPGADAPKADSNFNPVPTLPLKFDVSYPDCPPEMTVHLYEVKDSLKFYAEALLANPAASARIVAYSRSRSKAARMARELKQSLMRNQSINGARVSTQAISRRRKCSEVELWLMPKKT